MFADIRFRAQHGELVKGLMKVYFQYHYPHVFYKFSYDKGHDYFILHFGTPGIGDFLVSDFICVYMELDDICCKQECNLVVVSMAFLPYNTFFC